MEHPPLGRASRFKVRAIGDTVYTLVGGNTELTIDVKQKETETTSKDDNGNQRFRVVSREFSGSLTSRLLSGDPGQELCWQMIMNGTELEFIAYFDEVVGHPQFTGTFYPQSMMGKAPLTEADTLDTPVRLNGVLRSSQT